MRLGCHANSSIIAYSSSQFLLKARYGREHRFNLRKLLRNNSCNSNQFLRTTNITKLRFYEI